MKKLFMALMAVLVLASCGGSKKETADNTAAPKAPEKVAEPQKKAETPADVLMLTADMMNNAAEKMQKAETADDVINAMSSMIAETKALKENYGDLMAQFDENEAEEKYAKELEAVEEAAMKYYSVLMELEERIEMTPEDEERLMNLLEAAGEI